MFNIDDLSTWTILMVEDDSDNTEMVRQIFLFHGVNNDNLHFAKNGNDGLQVLQQVSPQVILLDLAMPELDGWKMYEHIRANPETAKIPVIAVTAHAMEDEQERAKAMGFDGYIIKPFSIRTFVDNIKAVIREFHNNLES